MQQGRGPDARHTRPVRTAFAHDAVVDMDDDADLTGPGGAVTLALCGSFDHAPPCPLAPHHTQIERTGDQAQVHTIFATEPSLESEVRQHIDQALARGSRETPTGEVAYWQLMTSGAGMVQSNERDHGNRLISS